LQLGNVPTKESHVDFRIGATRDNRPHNHCIRLT
jgi:hypothetical protein